MSGWKSIRLEKLPYEISVGNDWTKIDHPDYKGYLVKYTCSIDDVKLYIDNISEMYGYPRLYYYGKTFDDLLSGVHEDANLKYSLTEDYCILDKVIKIFNVEEKNDPNYIYYLEYVISHKIGCLSNKNFLDIFEGNNTSIPLDEDFGKEILYRYPTNLKVDLNRYSKYLKCQK